MKRPQGFDSPRINDPNLESQKAKPERIAKSAARAVKPLTSHRKPNHPSARAKQKLKATEVNIEPTKARISKREVKSARNLASAEKLRRKVEKAEVKKFTRRSRARRRIWLTAISTVAVLVTLLVVAMFSPIMALRTIKVEGATSIPAKDLQAALSDQIGTPLALISFEQIKTELDRYPKIRSFVTEIVPPDTLVVKVTERTAIAQVQSNSGFQIIDPAGVVIGNSATRIENLPLMKVDYSHPDSVAFRSAVAVLIALPAEVRPLVESVNASSKDNVVLSLITAGQTVIWGSADRSELKAKVLQELMKVEGARSGLQFDVSAPLSPVVRGG